MSKPVGGRGHTAPYKTMVIRIPVDLYDQVDAMADKYRSDLEMGTNQVDADNDKLSKLSKIIDNYRSASKSSRDWTKCNQLIEELTAEILK
jgi:hypothetical protein